MAEVGRAWFRRVFEDNDAPMVWSDKIDFQAAYDASHMLLECGRHNGHADFLREGIDRAVGA